MDLTQAAYFQGFQAAKSQIEMQQKIEALQKQINEHYRKPDPAPVAPAQVVDEPPAKPEISTSDLVRHFQSGGSVVDAFRMQGL